ncbi:MAG: hypothetical protein IH602_01690 [Bryobacteraceae bacterium]|nr:hypothetical protein [Bryobacteraceae bacterium]
MFTGKERDAETGLDYFESRYFSSAQGRFTSPDALIAKREWMTDPQRWNRYAYVRNNPLRYVDPNGEDATIVYSVSNLTQDQVEWWNKNKAAVLDTIAAKYKAAGVRVTLINLADLSKDQEKRLRSAPFQPDPRMTGTPGTARLDFASNESDYQRGSVLSGIMGRTGGGQAAVFLSSLIGEGASRNGRSSCDAVCAVANTAAHELGHAYGFADEGHSFPEQVLGFAWQEVTLYMFRPPDVMDSTNSPFRKPLGYASDKNRRAIDELQKAPVFK